MMFKILLITHILGDFYLHNDKSTIKKREVLSINNFFKSENFVHSLKHALLSLIVFLFYSPSNQWNYFVIFITILLSHYLINLLKSTLSQKFNSRNQYLFIADQLIHLFIMYLISIFIAANFNRILLFSLNELYIDWILAVSLIGNTASVFFKIFFHTFIPSKEEIDININFDSSKWIGILERLLILILLTLGEFTSVGVLISVKLYARFNHNNLPEEVKKNVSAILKLENYYIIGTLYSMLYALMTYLIFFS